MFTANLKHGDTQIELNKNRFYKIHVFHRYEFPQIRSNFYGKKDNFNGDVRGKMFCLSK